MLQYYDHEARGGRILRQGVIGSTKSRGPAPTALPMPPPPSVAARTLLSMTVATRHFRFPPFLLARSPHEVAPASDSAFWGRHQIVRDALLPAPRAFVPWVSLVPMPCFYLLDGKRL